MAVNKRDITRLVTRRASTNQRHIFKSTTGPRNQHERVKEGVLGALGSSKVQEYRSRWDKMEALDEQMRQMKEAFKAVNKAAEDRIDAKEATIFELRERVSSLQNAAAERDRVWNAENERKSNETAHVQRIRELERLNDKLTDENSALQELVDDLSKQNSALRKEVSITAKTASRNQEDLLVQLRKEREKLRAWGNHASPAALTGVPTPPVASGNPIEPTLSVTGHSGFGTVLENEIPAKDGDESIGPLTPRGSDMLPGSVVSNCLSETDKSMSMSMSSELQVTAPAAGQSPGAPTSDESFLLGEGLRPRPSHSPQLPPIPREHIESETTGVQGSFTTSSPRPAPDVHTESAKDPQSDPPEFLMARSLKRRRKPATPVKGESQHPHGSCSSPVVIKSEPGSSPAPGQPLVMPESLDRSSPHRKSPRRPRQSDTALLSRPSMASPSGRKQRAILGEMRVMTPLARGTPLQPIDGNVRKSRFQETKSAAGKKRKSDGHLVAQIPELADDGESFGVRSQSPSRVRAPEQSEGLQDCHGRLEQLLSDSPRAHTRPVLTIPEAVVKDMEEIVSRILSNCTDKRMFVQLVSIRCLERDWDWWDKAHDLCCPEAALPYSHPRERDRRRADAAARLESDRTPKAISLSAPELSHRPTEMTPTPARTTSRPSTSSKLRPQIRTPYRALPLSALNPAHFKLNPAANQNLKHAYTDVVRGSARAHLPGCTRPECCGPQFAALAQNLPPSAAQAQYISGNTSAQGVITAQSLANKYGKAHRAVHARPKSPPGFWDVDFPTSQERAEQLKEAQRREAEETERRWRIARGEGGQRGQRLWIFADE